MTDEEKESYKKEIELLDKWQIYSKNKYVKWGVILSAVGIAMRFSFVHVIVPNEDLIKSGLRLIRVGIGNVYRSFKDDLVDKKNDEPITKSTKDDRSVENKKNVDDKISKEKVKKEENKEEYVYTKDDSIKVSEKKSKFINSLERPNYWYTIRRGDNLINLATEHGMYLDEVLELNPKFKEHPKKIRWGTKMKLKAWKLHLVKKGNTFRWLKEEYGVNVRALKAANPKVKNGPQQETLIVIPYPAK